MHNSHYLTIAELSKQNVLFAVATVVRREAPSSGKAGDKAVVSRFGEITGWIGGGCVQGVVRKEAGDAMQSGMPRLVRIGKNLANGAGIDGAVDYKMTCQSEGMVEIFIEPMIPQTHLVVIGKSEIAKALVKLAYSAGYRVTGVAQDADLKTFEKVDQLITQYSLQQVKTSASSFIVVATQGDQDEAVLLEALSVPHAYLGFVASRKKMKAVGGYLKDAGISEELINAIHAPAGIDINAKQPFEVAISILAEMVEVYNSMENFTGFESVENQPKLAAQKAPQWYINPVCGVPVDMNNPRHVMQYRDEKVYFCCDGCKIKFEKDPEKYITAREMGLAPEGM